MRLLSIQHPPRIYAQRRTPSDHPAGSKRMERVATKEPWITPDLSEADLSHADLSKANLTKPNLRY